MPVTNRAVRPNAHIILHLARRRAIGLEAIIKDIQGAKNFTISPVGPEMEYWYTQGHPKRNQYWKAVALSGFAGHAGHHHARRSQKRNRGNSTDTRAGARQSHRRDSPLPRRRQAGLGRWAPRSGLSAISLWPAKFSASSISRLRWKTG